MAVRGETFAAFFAGERAASKTVISPNRILAIILIQLIPKSGMDENHCGFIIRIAADKIQKINIDNIIPIGIAVLHQYNPSNRTKRIICFFVAPRQRSIPKNSVLFATLLLRLLEIIKIQVSITIRERIKAT